MNAIRYVRLMHSLGLQGILCETIIEPMGSYREYSVQMLYTHKRCIAYKKPEAWWNLRHSPVIRWRINDAFPVNPHTILAKKLQWLYSTSLANPEANPKWNLSNSQANPLGFTDCSSTKGHTFIIGNSRGGVVESYSWREPETYPPTPTFRLHSSGARNLPPTPP